MPPTFDHPVTPSRFERGGPRVRASASLGFGVLRWSGVALHVLAGVATSSGAAAGEDLPLVRELRPPMDVKVGTSLEEAFPERRASFADRSVLDLVVYDTATNAFASPISSVAISHVLEDLSFANGPYAPTYLGPRLLSGMQYAFGINQASAFNLRFSFYRTNQIALAGFSAPGASVLQPAAQPFYTLTVTGFDTTLAPGFLTRSGFFNLPAPVALSAGDTSLYVQAAVVQPGTPGTAPLTSANLLPNGRVSWAFGTNTTQALGTQFTGAVTETSLGFAGNPANPGATHPQYMCDLNADGVFVGQSLVHPSGVSNERRYLNTNVGTVPGQARGYVFGLVGQVVNTPLISAININSSSGFLPDGTVSASNTITAAIPFVSYTFNLKNPINLSQLTFFDIDSEGSSAPMAIALYRADSTLVATGQSRGSGPDAPPSAQNRNAYQLSFGTPRRSGTDNGAAFEGQEGSLAAGQYFLVVALAGTSFADGFNFATVPPPAPRTTQITLNSNNQLTFVVPAAVPPTIDPTLDLGVLRLASVQTPSITVPPRGVLWARFTLSNPLPTPAQTGPLGQPLPEFSFLDLTAPGSALAGNWNFAIYNSAGSLVLNGVSFAGGGFNGNPGAGDGPFGGGGTFPQLSFGTAASRGVPAPDPGQTAGRALSNQNGASLPPGDYYLAVTLGNGLFSSTRWAARSTSESSLSARVRLTANPRPIAANCPADLNGDGVVDNSDFVVFTNAYSIFLSRSGDMNNDTFTDALDFVLFAAAYNDFACP